MGNPYDEWELLNYDGFIYKHEKRPNPYPTASSSAVHPPPDPTAEIRQRMERKKRALLKLRDKYSKEISLWELLSNTLKYVSKNQEALAKTAVSDIPTSEEPSPVEETSREAVIDELLRKVEGEEAMIQRVSDLCDVAESLCTAEEERLQKQLSELPIWEPSPQELMAALTER